VGKSRRASPGWDARLPVWQGGSRPWQTTGATPAGWLLLLRGVSANDEQHQDQDHHGQDGRDRGQQLAERAGADPADGDDAKLARYRAALEAGAGPALVTDWIAEVTARRAELDAQRQLRGASDRMSEAQIRDLIGDMASARQILLAADEEAKGPVYQQLGLRLIYRPKVRTAGVRVNPGPNRNGWGYGRCPRGDLNPHPLIRGLAPQASASAIPPLGRHDLSIASGRSIAEPPGRSAPGCPPRVSAGRPRCAVVGRRP
jgi:hypothetical protein